MDTGKPSSQAQKRARDRRGGEPRSEERQRSRKKDGEGGKRDKPLGERRTQREQVRKAKRESARISHRINPPKVRKTRKTDTRVREHKKMTKTKKIIKSIKEKKTAHMAKESQISSYFNAESETVRSTEPETPAQLRNSDPEAEEAQVEVSSEESSEESDVSEEYEFERVTMWGESSEKKLEEALRSMEVRVGRVEMIRKDMVEVEVGELYAEVVPMTLLAAGIHTVEEGVNYKKMPKMEHALRVYWFSRFTTLTEFKKETYKTNNFADRKFRKLRQQTNGRYTFMVQCESKEELEKYDAMQKVQFDGREVHCRKHIEVVKQMCFRCLKVGPNCSSCVYRCPFHGVVGEHRYTTETRLSGKGCYHCNGDQKANECPEVAEAEGRQEKRNGQREEENERLKRAEENIERFKQAMEEKGEEVEARMTKAKKEVDRKIATVAKVTRVVVQDLIGKAEEESEEEHWTQLACLLEVIEKGQRTKTIRAREEGANGVEVERNRRRKSVSEGSLGQPGSGQGLS